MSWSDFIVELRRLFFGGVFGVVLSTSCVDEETSSMTLTSLSPSSTSATLSWNIAINEEVMRDKLFVESDNELVYKVVLCWA